MNDILLVEDDTMIASGITYVLETEGYEVCHATTVTDAHDFIKKKEFHLAIVDMQLPVVKFDIKTVWIRKDTVSWHQKQ